MHGHEAYETKLKAFYEKENLANYDPRALSKVSLILHLHLETKENNNLMLIEWFT